jgi:NAD(P)-dependent dehydrogenase (short-subunit alcohol dehydrogenase family)
MGEGRIVLITGANSGIGKEAAFIFAKEGHTVIMACRNMERSRAVQQEITEKTSNEKVELMQLDVGSFQSIQQFCDAFKEKYERLDCLIHNAAYLDHGSPFRLSPDNIELTFATNVVGPYLMTNLLLIHLKKSQDARILHASSNIIKHFFDPKENIDFDQVVGEREDVKGFSVYEMYKQSKMAFVLLTFKMAEEYKEHNIKVNAVHINGAKMSKETLSKVTPKWRMIARIQNLFFPPPVKFGEIYYSICTSEEFKTVTGKLINDKKDIMTVAGENPSLLMQVKQLAGNKYYSRYADDIENQEKLWQLCTEQTEFVEVV